MRNSNLNAFPNNIKEYPYRQVYALVLNSPSNIQEVNRKFTQVDFAPTFLENLGFSCPALGFGRSLLNKEPTLVEKFGKKGMEIGIQNNQIDFQKIIGGILNGARK